MCTGKQSKVPDIFQIEIGSSKYGMYDKALITSIEHISGAQPVTGVVLSPNGSHLLTASFGYLWLWNVSTRELTHERRSISPMGRMSSLSEKSINK